MFICNECKKVFDQDDIIEVHDDPSPDGVSLVSGYYTYYECPHCGSGDIKEAVECQICGDYYADDGEEICLECFNTIERKIDDVRTDIGIDHELFAKIVRQIY